MQPVSENSKTKHLPEKAEGKAKETGVKKRQLEWSGQAITARLSLRLPLITTVWADFIAQESESPQARLRE